MICILPALYELSLKPALSLKVLKLTECQLHAPAPITHIGNVSVLLPWFQARYRKEYAQQRSAPSLPLVENLLKDNTDGCALTTLVHFYCSQVVRLEGETNTLYICHTLPSLTNHSLLYCNILKSKPKRIKSVIQSEKRKEVSYNEKTAKTF